MTEHLDCGCELTLQDKIDITNNRIEYANDLISFIEDEIVIIKERLEDYVKEKSPRFKQELRLVGVLRSHIDITKTYRETQEVILGELHEDKLNGER